MDARQKLARGGVIPAHPLALNAARRLDERRQRALTKYYLDAGVDGIAVAVHTTQFAIRRPEVGLYRPVLELAAEEMRGRDAAKIAGVCGATAQATAEAGIAKDIGYDAVLLSLGGLADRTAPQLIVHVRAVAEIVPVVGFYLQPSVGGRALPLEFWREMAGIPNVVAIKIAPFNRYQTLDVLRAVAESGRSAEIALYTGNDDSILTDLMTTWDFGGKRLRLAGGLLGHWSVWTRRAVEQMARVRSMGDTVPAEMLTLAQQITDSNAAFFDPSHHFAGCIAGLHEVLRRQGLLEGTWCLEEREGLSPGQAEEIDRVYRIYPHLADDDFVRENLDRWLR
jgi:dihydrodipicolinate synthase/N-acetylneuraminate lyase